MPTTQQILDGFSAHYTLGDADMDQTHEAFLRLCLAAAAAQGPEFVERFVELFQHTQAHFSDEETRMQATGFPAYAEHRADHQRILGEMDRFCQRIQGGRTTMARAWLNDNLPAWFDTHARTMDSALAAHLKDSGD